MVRLFVTISKIFTAALCVALVSAACGPQQTMKNQGRGLCCYNDTTGIPTIGIGFQLNRDDATKAMAAYNLSVSNILTDCQRNTKIYCLTDNQAEDLFYNLTYREATACADRYVPNLPTMTRAAVIDVAVSGCKTLHTFLKMKISLEIHDWKQAAEELRNSLWCKHVKQRRCNSDYNCIANETYSDLLYSSVVSDCSFNSDCHYYTTLNGKFFSTSRIQCSQFPNCTYCLSSTSVCIKNACCAKPICVPLTLNGTCNPNSMSSLSLSDLQLSFNSLVETINRTLTLAIIIFSCFFIVMLFLSVTVFYRILHYSSK